MILVITFVLTSFYAFYTMAADIYACIDYNCLLLYNL